MNFKPFGIEIGRIHQPAHDGVGQYGCHQGRRPKFHCATGKLVQLNAQPFPVHRPNFIQYQVCQNAYGSSHAEHGPVEMPHVLVHTFGFNSLVLAASEVYQQSKNDHHWHTMKHTPVYREFAEKLSQAEADNQINPHHASKDLLACQPFLFQPVVNQQWKKNAHQIEHFPGGNSRVAIQIGNCPTQATIDSHGDGGPPVEIKPINAGDSENDPCAARCGEVNWKTGHAGILSQ